MEYSVGIEEIRELQALWKEHWCLMTIEEVVDKLRLTYDQYKEKKAESTKLYHEVESLELQLQDMISDLDPYEYEKIRKELKVSIVITPTCKIPDSDENKQAVFQWMKEKGYYDDYITITSNSLNSLVKKENELNKDTPDSKIPGIEIKERVTVKY